MEEVGRRFVTYLDARAPATPLNAVREVTAVWRSVLENSRVTSGCAIAAVAVAGNTGPRAATGAVFIAWQASIEDAIVMSRAQESLKPFDSVVAQLERLVTADS